MMEKEGKNNFTKTLLQSYIITRCDRRLFLELSRKKPKLWLNPIRSTIKPKRKPLTSDLLQELGKDYEQQVYSRLKQIKNTKFQEIKGKVDKLYLSSDEFLNFYRFLNENPDQDILLLEFQFRIPPLFFQKLFTPKTEVYDIPVNVGSQRPDILVIGNKINEYIDEVFELRPNGNFRKIPSDKLEDRIGISIFDIKKTRDDRIGKKHFVEIFYYLWTIAQFLKANNLYSKFYIRANFNGIFPEYTQDKLDLITNLDDIIQDELVTLISWEESRRIFLRIYNKIRSLWQNSPRAIESVPLNMHQGCGYCQYIEDCKNTLGCNEYSNPSDWSLRLIPFTSPSIAEQLISDFGYRTIGDVLNNIDSIRVGNIPRPLYPELPHLKIKARALIEGKIIYPTYNQTHSYAIPQYSPIALNFGVEYDINNDKVFVVGIFFRMFIHSNLKYHKRFNKWWNIWRDALNNSSSIEEIQSGLNEILLWEIPLETVKSFLNYVKSLKYIQIFLLGEKPHSGTEITYNFAEVNENLSKESEARLAISMISNLYLLLEMSTIIEEYIVTEGYEKDKYFRPNTSLFHWGQKQLNNFEEMIERNLDYIIDDKEILSKYERILYYFRPSDTEVANPYQHKKIFDVQKFAESCIGFPNIINYTWHSIANKLFPITFSPKFWIPHFNFLDLNNWLRFLSPKNTPEERQEIRYQIERQQLLKLQMIDQIRYKFQIEGNVAISENARPISREKYRSTTLPSNYHAIAHVWYIFSLRLSALQLREAEHYRTMFPDFSIGKMAAAKVHNLRISYTGSKKVHYKFETRGLSSNMKIKEGDIVLLIPLSKRDLEPNFEIHKWTVTIRTITWDSNINGNHIVTEFTYNDVFERRKEEGIPPSQDWYIYHITFDSWSGKLSNAKSDGLFERENLGESWLGHRFSSLWKIRSHPELYWPSLWEFDAPSVYLFAPELLPRRSNSNTEDQRLNTPIYPLPDHSQEEAINNSMNHTISAILGPPGTGKSQTIAALIDEYLCRRQKEGRPTTTILVTSFSYAALRVVIEKIRERSRDKDGKPTLSSQTQMIFLRSERESPIESKEGCRDVDDLVRKSNKAWTYNGQPRIVTNTKPLERQLEDSCILFANAHQLYHLKERVEDDFAFDLICVDEASQLPADYFMSSLQFIHKCKLKVLNHSGNGTPDTVISNLNKVKNLTLDKANTYEPLTQVVIVGDHNQLPPVWSITPPKKLEPVINSLFSYYVDSHQIPSKQLKVNYRSHRDIVEFTSSLGFYHDLRAHENNSNITLKGNINNVESAWLKTVLSPEKVICSIEHDNKFEIGISTLEATLVSKIVSEYYRMINPRNEAEEIDFWSNSVGVVAPHNAQGRTIIQDLFQEIMPKSHLEKSVLMDYLKSSIYSVEKFQGSDRDLIITSIGLSDIDKIEDETDFIFNINRFNVLTSRAKRKIIFIASKEILNFIPEDRNAIENASKFNFYVNKFCNTQTILNVEDESKKLKQIKFRFKS